MTDVHLQHDPRTKMQIKDLLYNTLYGPVEKSMKAWLDTLIVRNTLLTSSSHKSFTYKGRDYSCDSAPLPRQRVRLVAELRPEMDEYLAELKTLNDEELPYVLGYINQVLNASDDLQDYLRLLPNALHHPLEQAIATCPCRKRSLDEAGMALLQQKNTRSIDLIKQRMVKNLLI